MPQTAPGRVYEVWIKRGGRPSRPTRCSLSTPRTATVGVPGNLPGVKVVMVTSEPVGGSPLPTRSP